MTTFSFKNPDGTIRVIDLVSVFPAGTNSSSIRDFGVSIAEQYADVCDCLMRADNEHRGKPLSPGIDSTDIASCTERVGVMLGQQIHRHLLHNETYADIWAEVSVRLARASSGIDVPHIHIIDGAGENN